MHFKQIKNYWFHRYTSFVLDQFLNCCYYRLYSHWQTWMGDSFSWPRRTLLMADLTDTQTPKVSPDTYTNKHLPRFCGHLPVLCPTREVFYWDSLREGKQLTPETNPPLHATREWWQCCGVTFDVGTCTTFWKHNRSVLYIILHWLIDWMIDWWRVHVLATFETQKNMV